MQTIDFFPIEVRANHMLLSSLPVLIYQLRLPDLRIRFPSSFR